MQEPLNFLKKELKENQTIIVACSGGPDSMALLYLTTILRRDKQIKIICAHVNHNVRKESQDEALFVKNFCMKNKIEFESYTINNYHKDNFHADARKIRYDFFKKIYNKYQANYLLTAHHGDDLVETILMRLVRGSTITGYAGFNIKSKMNDMNILRPLIFVTKEEIEKFDKQNKISYVIDKSNYKDVYTRNRYRKYILPFLKEENPLVHQKFHQFSQELFLLSSFLNKEVNKYYQQVIEKNKINITSFLKCDLLIQQEILKQYLLNNYPDEIEKITKKHLNILLDFINKEKRNDNISFPNQMTVIKDNNYIYLKKEKKLTLEKQILKLPFTLEDNHSIKKIEATSQDGNDICRLYSKEISLPLYIRKRQKGDKMLVKNMKGHKNINDIFMENHIHPLKRDSYPIIEDAKGNIVWLPNLKKSQFNKTKTEKYDIILKYY